MRSNSSIPLTGALLLVLLLPGKADSCSCAHRTPCEAFGDTTAVFIGRMMGGSERVETRSKGDVAVEIEAGMVRFAVQETFKGAVGTEVTVSISSNKGTSCGPYGLIRGETYVVYAYANGTELSTGVCTRTAPVSQAVEDLDFLRHLPEAGSGRLYGRVWADKRDGRSGPLSGVTLIVRGADNQIRVVTNEKGEFELADLKPGKYHVEPVWPEHYASEHSEEDITISDRGCTSVGFEAKLNGRISGRVSDANRRGTSLMLHLVQVESRDGSRDIRLVLSKRGFSGSCGKKTSSSK